MKKLVEQAERILSEGPDAKVQRLVPREAKVLQMDWIALRNAFKAKEDKPRTVAGSMLRRLLLSSANIAFALGDVTLSRKLMSLRDSAKYNDIMAPPTQTEEIKNARSFAFSIGKLGPRLYEVVKMGDAKKARELIASIRSKLDYVERNLD